MTHPEARNRTVSSRADDGAEASGEPRTTAELRTWVRRRFALSAHRESELFRAVEQVVANQRQLIEESKHDAIRLAADVDR